MNTSKSECAHNRTALFPLGQIVATPGALEALEASDQSAMEFVERHAAGDWGELSAGDVAENESALRNAGRLLSSYTAASGQKFWVITEADRSATTLLLPDE